jgi:predicted nucleic acid-binding protein
MAVAGFERILAVPPLGQREHNADRWIAATAIRLGVPLVSNDAIFHGMPGLTLESAP